MTKLSKYTHSNIDHDRLGIQFNIKDMTPANILSQCLREEANHCTVVSVSTENLVNDVPNVTMHLLVVAPHTLS
jgi:hypothetical protein